MPAVFSDGQATGSATTDTSSWFSNLPTRRSTAAASRSQQSDCIDPTVGFYGNVMTVMGHLLLSSRRTMRTVVGNFKCHCARRNSQIQPAQNEHTEHTARRRSHAATYRLLNHGAFLVLQRPGRKEFGQVFGPIWVSPRSVASITCLRRSSRRASRSSSASLIQSGQDTPSR